MPEPGWTLVRSISPVVVNYSFTSHIEERLPAVVEAENLVEFYAVDIHEAVAFVVRLDLEYMHFT